MKAFWSNKQTNKQINGILTIKCMHERESRHAKFMCGGEQESVEVRN